MQSRERKHVSNPDSKIIYRERQIEEYDDFTQMILLHWYIPWFLEKERNALLSKEKENMTEEFGRAPLPTEFGDYTYIVYGDMRTGQHHNVLVFGQLNEGSLGDGEDVLCRVHSACWTNEVAHAVNCECRKELQQTLELIQKEGRGVLIYLDQEGRGTGIAGKMAQLNGMFEWGEDGICQKRDPETGERIDTDRAYKEAGYPSECRRFHIAGEILAKLGVKSVRLLTNNPDKIKDVEEYGISVNPTGIHITPDNEIIACDLRSKKNNLGHYIPEEALQCAAK